MILLSSSVKVKVATSYKGIVLYEPWDARCDEKDAAMRLGFGSVGFHAHVKI